MAPRLDIVIPVYNEGNIILATLAELRRQVSTPSRILICYDRPVDGLYVKGIRNTIKRASVVGGGDLACRRFMRAEWASQPGIAIIDLPAAAVDPDATVVKLELQGPLDLLGDY